MNMKKSFGMAACAMLLMMACTGQKGAAQGESGAEDSLAADTAFAASDTLVFKGAVRFFWIMAKKRRLYQWKSHMRDFMYRIICGVKCMIFQKMRCLWFWHLICMMNATISEIMMNSWIL